MARDTFNFKNSQVYFRDKFVPFSEANLSIASSPVLYGLSIYTVFSIKYNSKNKKLYIFRLEDHFKRLVDSAKIMDFHGFVNDWDYIKFEEAMLELIKQNKVSEDVLVRVTVFIDEIIAGTKIHGLKNSLSAYIYPMGAILPKNGVNACVSSWQRTPDNSIPSRAKINGSYVNASLMKNEAILNGYDEAIALDLNGHVTEGTIANIFLVKNNVLSTPDETADILEGITRNTVHQMAESLRLEYHKRVIDRSELYIADEIFFCGSSANIAPVLSVDKRQIGSGKIGPITQKLSALYDQIRLKKNKQFSAWLTDVKL